MCAVACLVFHLPAAAPLATQLALCCMRLPSESQYTTPSLLTQPAHLTSRRASPASPPGTLAVAGMVKYGCEVMLPSRGSGPTFMVMPDASLQRVMMWQARAAARLALVALVLLALLQLLA